MSRDIIWKSSQFPLKNQSAITVRTIDFTKFKSKYGCLHQLWAIELWEELFLRKYRFYQCTSTIHLKIDSWQRK